MGEEGIISLKSFLQDPFVYCIIKDNGIGIEEQQLQNIFDPFFSTKEVGEGTGLGLSISHEIIVVKHQGEIMVDSTKGEGTTFTIKLPIKKKKMDKGDFLEKNTLGG